MFATTANDEMVEYSMYIGITHSAIMCCWAIDLIVMKLYIQVAVYTEKEIEFISHRQ